VAGTHQSEPPAHISMIVSVLFKTVIFPVQSASSITINVIEVDASVLSMECVSAQHFFPSQIKIN
jgi:hypothetical protein